MTRTFIRAASIATTLTLAIPLWAQRGQGGGVGRAAGSVTGAATGAVSGTVSGPTGRSGNGASSNGANEGRGLGASADVGLRVSQNSGLSAQLQPLLPAGSTLAGAATSFRDEGQFVAALHVAHNLNIPFDQLKAKVTGSDSVSLGQAIRELRPNLDDKAVKSSIQLAGHQAERDVKESAGKPGPFVARIESNAALASRLQTLLPQGATLQSAAAGFKNEGQFIATLEAAKTLNLSFADLKDRVTAGQSLGEAIHALRPSLSEETSESAANQAEAQAKVMRAGTPEPGPASSKP